MQQIRPRRRKGKSWAPRARPAPQWEGALAIELRREQRVATIDADVKSGLFDATLDDRGLAWYMKTGSSSVGVAVVIVAWLVVGPALFGGDLGDGGACG